MSRQSWSEESGGKKRAEERESIWKRKRIGREDREIEGRSAGVQEEGAGRPKTDGSGEEGVQEYRNNDFAKTLLYHVVPMYYTWNKNLFIRRKRGEDVEGYPRIKKDTALGRIYTIHPKQTECFYLRMLLHHVRGPTSFENIRTVNGVVKSTFQDACQELGLLENDNQWKDTLAEAAILRSASRMRELFAIILVFCQPAKPSILWEIFEQNLCEDILLREQRRYNDKTIMLSEEIINQALCELEDKVVALSEKYLVNYGMPIPKRSEKNAGDLYDVILKCPFDKKEMQDYVSENLPKLVPDQRQAFEKIIDSVIYNRGNVFFLDAPGGTGKTFLINLLLAKVRSTCGIAIGVASS
ncbi:PREDICTED: uncharacterized protein LOC105556120, partial [Vollenhovia emeryi]|uniref:uncharacterized protein LOC105556120 n=1 Tax=Vollenhovia emeryi TaxID=411798 RepID=UPI0005F3AEDE